jgi:hypothetical protein
MDKAAAAVEGDHIGCSLIGNLYWSVVFAVFGKQSLLVFKCAAESTKANYEATAAAFGLCSKFLISTGTFAAGKAVAAKYE